MQTVTVSVQSAFMLAFSQALSSLHHWSIASSMTDGCTRCQSGVALSAAVETLKLTANDNIK